MNTRKALLALAAIPALTLGACGQETETEPAPSSLPQSESPAQNAVKPLNLGEEITIENCNGGGPCEVKVTFDDIKLTKTCPHGVSFPDMESMDPEGTQYLTVSGKFEVVSSLSNFSLEETDFQGVTKDGVAAEPGIAYDCDDLGVDQNLDNPVDPGLTRKGELTMAVKPGLEKIQFSTMWDENTYEFDMSKLKLEDGSGEVPGYAMGQTEPEQQVPTQVETPQPDPVFNSPGDGYQCPGTDAFVDNPADCTSQNLGGDPAYDEMYPGGYPQQPSPQQPSPWVQGQIDWNNCIQGGNTPDECAEMLN
ncbi:hypothetical protein [Corynebacterium sp. ED61]|uniref:hypothetical protein n=1 Tax=Corynebacterium sp. ED61 TaxID=2211360 RepID=UPI0018842201|nr:hypothetical protein [Corynebacterium sp. ED61]MBF0580853.1 hypothetical protein [Corynebacterium sp. ED61]